MRILLRQRVRPNAQHVATHARGYARLACVPAALLALAIGAGVTGPKVAWASHGGPEVAVPLGWDPVDRKVFFSIEHHDESEPDFGSTVIYFTRSDSSWAGPARVRWSHSPDDSLFQSEMKKLRRRLRPLEEESGPAIFQYMHVLSVDTLKSEYWGPIARYRLEVSDGVCGCRFEVTALTEPSVRLIRRFRVPGKEYRFGILSFLGIPYETIYEVQIPVVLDGKRVRRVEWKPWE